MVQKLKRIQVEEKLKAIGLSVFTPVEFQGFFGVSKNTASLFIARNCKSGLFVKLRNNYYTLKDSNPDYAAVANRLYQPSYISLETALSYHRIIPETVYGTTSVTTKAPREFRTSIGNFTYRHIKKGTYTGYQLQEVDRYKAFIAEPEKALADYLYFVDLGKASLNDRLKLNNVNKRKLIVYATLFRRPRMLKFIDRIYVDARKSRKIY